MPLDSLSIRPEGAADHAVVADLHARAFEDPDRVPALVDGLRVAPATLPPISLVATADDQVIGHVLLSACRLDAPRRLVDVFTLSPLAVDPAWQRRGAGTALIRAALAAADDSGVPLVFLEGAPDYYGPRGFGPAGALGFRRPSLRIPEPGFQVACLSAYEPWMTGTFVYSETFWRHDCVGLRDEPAADRPDQH